VIGKAVAGRLGLAHNGATVKGGPDIGRIVRLATTSDRMPLLVLKVPQPMPDPNHNRSPYKSGYGADDMTMSTFEDAAQSAYHTEAE
jgi:hypothetical protein